MNILDRIIEYKRREVAAAKTNAPQSALEALAAETRPRGFKAQLERAAATGFALIAEIKKASPSKGLIRKDFDPAAHARDYVAGGATCLSVLTDGPSFQGSPDDLRAARARVDAPILRKDFTIDPYQIVEARAWGADCVLLIAACLDDAQLGDLAASAERWSLDALVEVHDAAEMDRALSLGMKFIGVNNRNLKTFDTDLAVTESLAANAAGRAFLVSESGITDHGDLKRLAAAGARGFLVGERLMRQPDLAAATRALLDGPRVA